MNFRDSMMAVGVAAGFALAAGFAAGQAVPNLVPIPEGSVVVPVQEGPDAEPAKETPKLAVDAISDYRANGPLPVARYAVPLVPCHYTGYYVGGGCPWFGSGPSLTQGTWGWDYVGHGWIVRHVWLKYCDRYQGGIGAYNPNGPHVPDVFAIKLHHHEPECPEP